MSFPFRDGSLDFLIANHVLEHLPNPLKALGEWHRCLKEGGALYLSVPDKRFCGFCAGTDEWIYPDAARQLTTWDHLLDDFGRDDDGLSQASREHARDEVRYVQRAPINEIEAQVDRFLSTKPDYHHHTWTYESLLATVNRSAAELGLDFRREAELSSYETWGEMILVLKKDGATRRLRRAQYRYLEWNISHMDTAPGELLEGDLWQQSFTCTHDGLNSVHVRFGTFARSNTGALLFRLHQDGPAAPLVEERIDVSDLRDNSFRVFEFAPLAGSAGRRFHFTLESIGASPGNAVTVWCAWEDHRDLRLTANGSHKRGTVLNFKALSMATLDEEDAWSETGPSPPAKITHRLRRALRRLWRRAYRFQL